MKSFKKLFCYIVSLLAYALFVLLQRFSTFAFEAERALSKIIDSTPFTAENNFVNHKLKFNLYNGK